MVALRWQSLWTGIAVFATLDVCAGLEILNYHDTDAAAGSPAQATANFVRDAALQIPGANLTVVGTNPAFKTEFDMGGWDVVVVSSWSGISGTTDIDNAVLDRLQAHDAAGGRVVFNAWHMHSFTAHPFFSSTVPMTISTTYSTPMPIHSWDPMHPLWTTPNVVPSPIAVGMTYTFAIDGHLADPGMGTTAVGGYGGAAPAATQAGILVGPNGAIVNTFTPQQHDMTAMVDLLVNEILYLQSASTCAISAPAAMATVSGDVALTFDGDDTEGDPIDAFFEWSTDGGATWIAATAAAGSPLSNPDLGRSTPYTGQTFLWDSAGDGVGVAAVQATSLRITVTDGTTMGTCSVDVDVDNVVPPPQCTLTVPPGPLAGVVPVDVAITAAAMPVAITLEFSIDGGATYATMTMDATSANPNPVTGVPPGAAAFAWASRADGVGLAAVAPGVILRATVDDGVALAAGTCSAIADVDNTALCGGLCGDCNLNGFGHDVLDALEAAQIAALLFPPTAEQEGCCDVDASLNVSVIDALLIAQAAAGLPAALTCP